MDKRHKDAVAAAIANIIGTGVKLADCKDREMALDGQRSQVKSEAIARIMDLGDPQKGNKAYSASAAAEIVMNDKVFALHESDRRQATAATIRAAAEYEAAKLAARFQISESEIDGFEPLRLALNDAHAMVLR